jgi:hypothetical protein
MRYSLPTPQRTSLGVFEAAGRRVLSQDFGVQAAGEHRQPVAASELGAGRTASHGVVLLMRLTHGRIMKCAKGLLY